VVGLVVGPAVVFVLIGDTEPPVPVLEHPPGLYDSQVDAGVQVGYDRDGAGAMDAATNNVVALGSGLTLEAASPTSTLAAVSAGGVDPGVAVRVADRPAVEAVYAQPASPPIPPDSVEAVDPCEAVPLLLAPTCRSRQGSGDALASFAGRLPDPGASLVGGIGETALLAFTQFIVDGAVWFLGQVATVVTDSTSVSVTTDWFTTHYRSMAAVAAMLATAFLLLSCIGVIVHRDPARLARSVALLAVAGAGTGMVLVITTMLLVISDAMSAYVARTLTGDLTQALTGATTGLGSLTSESNGGVPLFAALLAALFAAVAAVVIWLELLLREVAIYATVLFFPVGLAGLVWEGSRRWARHLAEILVALIFSKFVIVAILSLASAGLAGGAEGYAGVLAGAAMLAVAAYSPFLLLRVVGVLEVTGAAVALEGVRSRATRTATSNGYLAMRTVQTGRAVVGRLVVAGGGGPGGVAAATVAAPRSRPGGAGGGGSTGRPPPTSPSSGSSPGGRPGPPRPRRTRRTDLDQERDES
jgi:hypothetical protein